MSLTASAVGRTTPPVTHDVDSRWLMAYAASVDALAPVYLDTTRPGGIEGHPLFPVCLEWPAVLAARDVLAACGLTDDDARHGVHLSHDLRPARPVRPGDQLTTTATVAGVSTHRAGGLVDLDLITTDTDGELVAFTRMGTLYRGVSVQGEGQPAPALDPMGPSDLGDELAAPEPVPGSGLPVHELGAGAAHVYTECSRIWNPIHTDARTAAAAGLPGIILHGTATLALAVDDVLADADADPDRVRRIAARFAAVVLLPSLVQTRVTARSADGSAVGFDAVGGDGQPVLRHGLVVLAPQEAA